MRSSLHRLVWRHLPRGARRASLFALTRLLAPRRDPHARPAEPVIVVGSLRSATGLGESARLCYEALRAAKFDAYAVDLSRALLQPVDLPDYSFRDGSALCGAGTMIVHVNAPLLPLAFMRLGRRLLRRKWIVGYWAWELPVCPPEWRLGEPFVHQVWVPSRFVQAAVQARMPDLAVRVLPHPVACHASRPAARRSRGRPFTALVLFGMGSSFARKNPLAAVSAFRTAFGNATDARLIVKVTNGDLFAEGQRQLRAAADAENITVVERTLSRGERDELFTHADCLLSLHRSEGFGLAVAEAMCRSVPALATDWSATAEFVTTETGLPVPYRLIPARDPQGTYEFPELQWADADVTSAAEILRRFRDQPDSLGERAREDALQRFGAEAYGAAIRRFLAQASLPTSGA